MEPCVCAKDMRESRERESGGKFVKGSSLSLSWPLHRKGRYLFDLLQVQVKLIDLPIFDILIRKLLPMILPTFFENFS